MKVTRVIWSAASRSVRHSRYSSCGRKGPLGPFRSSSALCHACCVPTPYWFSSTFGNPCQVIVPSVSAMLGGSVLSRHGL